MINFILRNNLTILGVLNLFFIIWVLRKVYDNSQRIFDIINKFQSVCSHKDFVYHEDAWDSIYKHYRKCVDCGKIEYLTDLEWDEYLKEKKQRQIQKCKEFLASLELQDN